MVKGGGGSLQQWRPRLWWGTRLPGLLPAQGVRGPAQQPFMLVTPVLRFALMISLVGGLGLGGLLAVLQSVGADENRRWLALVDVHAMVQLTGFLLLFILGVGVHFLPRLRGAGLGYVGLARWGLLLAQVGVLVGAIAGVGVAFWPGRWMIGSAVACGRWLLFLGTVAVFVALLRTMRRGPPLTWRGGLMAMLPLLAFGLLALVVMLLLAAMIATLTVTSQVEPAWALPLVEDGLLWGFALPIAMAFSTRLLPIYLGVEVMRLEALLGVTFCVAIGVIVRLSAFVAFSPLMDGVGSLVLAAGVLLFCGFVGAPVGVRRAIRRSDPPQLVRAFRWSNLLIRSAYLWLVLVGVVLLVNGMAELAVRVAVIAPDAVQHLVALGYLTLLIFGVGARLLPGFAHLRPQADRRFLIALVAGNLAVVCRVVPVAFLFAGVTNGGLNAAYALSGPCILVAGGAFTLGVWPALSVQRAEKETD